MTRSLNQTELNIVWEKLPDDYILPDEPVESILQPLLAFALSESLDLAGLITSVMLIASNMGICAKINGKTVIKAPDWFFVPQVIPLSEGKIRRSYTPYPEGDLPEIVMEFLSETDAGEYSNRNTYPYGKLYYYEQILKVPFYIIFDPSIPLLEVRQLHAGTYVLLQPNQQGRYYIPCFDLFLGVWAGTRQKISANWLRWWDHSGNILLWGSEEITIAQQAIEQEQQRAELEHQRAEHEYQRAEQERQRAEIESQRASDLEAELKRYREQFGELP
jgi:Uma2 family endonuclease